MPPQISRLLLIAAAIVIIFSIAKSFLVPVSFKQYGWYRGNALNELRVLDVTYAGHEACEECHEDQAKKKAGSKHRTIGCESCHGANAAHARDPLVSPEKITNPNFCLRCHESDYSRPAKFPQINPADHYDSKQKCTECHKPHSPMEIQPK